MSETSSRVIVIGGGVVGMSTGLYLQRSGRNVTVIDPLPPPGGASYGNAGMISADSVVPVAMPGMLRQVPKWLLDPLGPLALNPRYFIKATPWLLRWIASGRLKRVIEISDAMRALHRDSFLRWEELLGPNHFSGLIHKTGQVQIWETDAETSGGILEKSLRERHNIPGQKLTRDDLRQMFPEMSERVRRGYLLPGNGFTVSPKKLIETLHALFLEAGGEFLPEQARAIVPKGAGGYGVFTNITQHHAGQVVVAAGVWSRHLVNTLGISVPLEFERGYHVMLPNSNVTVPTTIAHKTSPIGVSPMDGGLRVTGVVEIAGLDAPPDPGRAKALVENARALFPTIDASDYKPWMGHRPSTPDSLPVLGEAPKYRNLFLAFGHGHYGMTGGPPSADIITSLVNRVEPRMPIAPYSIERF